MPSTNAARRLTRTTDQQRRRNPLAMSLLAAALLATPVLAYAQTTPDTSRATAQAFDIPASSLAEALTTFGMQSGLQVTFARDVVAGVQSNGLKGSYTPAQALTELLRGKALEYAYLNGNTVVVRAAKPKAPALKAPAGKSGAAQSAEEAVKNMPAIMVTGTKTLNMDITRTEDDPQPYVVFDREQIERSGATSLEQFLQQRLTMNTSPVNDGSGIATTQIALRGLSATQTLILIDGHRVSSPSLSGANGRGSLGQADITGIPLAAIERIEVLPTTASGIYGGSATGGVINIIMRRDYTGIEVNFTYGNTFSTDVAKRNFDLTAGHNLNGGRTSLLVSATYSDSNDLRVSDRAFSRHMREKIWNNNPAFFLGPTGLPPLSVTPNITSTDGTNLVLKSGTPLNSSFTSVPRGYGGSVTDNSAALVGNAGIYQWGLANTAQVGNRGNGGRRALFTQPKVKAGGIVLRHKINENIQVFTDILSSYSSNVFPVNAVGSVYRVPSTSPGNPFIQDIFVSVPLQIDSEENTSTTTIERQRGVVGFVGKLPHKWHIGGDYTWDRNTVSYKSGLATPGLSGAIAAGVIDILRDINTFPLDISSYAVQTAKTSPYFQSTMKDATLRSSGPIWNFPGGAAILSASLSQREEVAPKSFYSFPDRNITYYYPDRSQQVTSAYLELLIPIFSGRNSAPGFRELDLQLAVRRDDYLSRSAQTLIVSDALSSLPSVDYSRNSFASVDPTVALKWKPWNDIALRASLGTGFLPPSLDQLVSPTATPGSPQSFGSTDPLRGDAPAGPYVLFSGGDPNLKPERSRSWSAGIILTPNIIDNFRVSVDYTSIEKTDNIGMHPEGIQGIINDEALFPGRVIRGSRLPTDPPNWPGPIEVVDNSVLNLSSAELDAWDLQIDYQKISESYGEFDLFFVGTWQPHYRTRTVATQPITENAGVGYYNPIKFKANAGVFWTRSAWEIGWTINHFGGYQTYSGPPYTINQGNNGRVPSQTYHDLFISYDFGMASNISSGLTGTRVRFGAQNIFNKRPPLDALSAGTGFYSPLGDPRMSSWTLSINTSF